LIGINSQARNCGVRLVLLDVQEAVRDVFALTRLERSELHIVHAWEKPDVKFWTGEHNYFPGDTSTLIYEIKNLHIKWLDDFLGQYDLQDLQHHEHVLQGWADEVISEFAEQHQIDLLVMGTVCRAGIPGFLIGNTAEKILHRINCSVLALKPDGFISPVQLDDQKF
jgi:nucleotide-binding universal stress UspA family protein